MSEKRASGIYMAGVIAAGCVCVLTAIARLPVNRADLSLLMIGLLTVVVGSRITVQIPRFKSHIAVSDTFVFLTLLLYGGEFAIILSALEALVASSRFCSKKLTVFFNASIMAISTGTAYLVLQETGLFSKSQLNGQADLQTNFAIVLSVAALVPFLVNTSLAAVYDSLRTSVKPLEIWKSKYVWTFFSYFVGAGAAGILIQLVDTLGIGVIFATFPAIYFVYLSYKMYMKNVEISMQQAEQAEQYAKILESQSNALRESEERFRSAFDHAPIGIGLIAPTGRWLRVNLAMSQILGYSEEELLKTDFQSITFPDDLGSTLIKVHELLSGKAKSSQTEQRWVHKSGRTVWISWSGSSVHERNSGQPNLIFQIQDITDKKCAEEKLHHDATHDALTGLPNRQFFMDRLQDGLDRADSQREHKVSVLFIDLDRFKYVNDSLGHLIGDALLREISVRLLDCMRPSDLVARLGGDEFTILVEGHYDIGEVTRIAERIQEKFAFPFSLHGHEVYSSASIGILNASAKHRLAEDVMRDADTAMYQAKRAGKARHVVFDEQMHNAAKEILRLETDLRRAVERDEITIHYQPIYALDTGHIESFESLARWEHPELGRIRPDKFIPLAEEIGLIDRVCEHVLRRACRDIGELNAASTDRKYSVSVNLSCRQFGKTDLVQTISGILRDTGFSSSHLRLEITESVFFEHYERAVAILNELRNQGVEIDVDDFGTGYSNLGYLRLLPISSLKIDRSFIGMIDANGENDEIVRAIITLARNLGLTVVAEGIETDVQRRVLEGLGCESGQGFLFARPMAIDELRSFLGSDANADLHPNLDPIPNFSLVS
ncbi:MAG: EAL domain-containing protein [Acidobacteria bacterium]|nr:EAL domain-containing protein [Acidobacteriota bacterium]